MLDGQFLLTQYGVKVELDITPYGKDRTWKALDQGFDNLDEALNDVVNEYFFLGDKGFGSDFVTGIHPKYTLSGTRVVGDPVQDYIFDNKFNLMAGRDTNLRISIPKADGTVTRFTSKVTLSDMKSFGGGTTDGGGVNVTLSFKGAPVVDTVAATTALTVNSTFGGTDGTTIILVTPYYADAGCKFVYTWGDSAADVNIGDVCIDWNDLTNGATFEIPNGKVITVAMVSSATFKIVGLGNTTVVSIDTTKLDVTSVAGVAVGTSKITIDPSTPRSGSYVYKITAEAPSVVVGDTVADGVAITSGAEIEATNGEFIGVYEIDGDNKVIALGVATIAQNTTMNTLTVSSEAGTQAGDSLITITGATGSLKYKVGDAAEDVTLLMDVSTWTDITSGSEITAETDKVITVAEVNADDKAIGSGSAVIVSA